MSTTWDNLRHYIGIGFQAAFLPITLPFLAYKIYKRISFTMAMRVKPLKGKVVLITGVSSNGLGEALAHTFHEAGCNLIIASRRLSELERVKKDLINNIKDSTHNSGSIEIVEIDFQNLAGIPEKAKEMVDKSGGRIDILVNNAGIGYRGLAEDTTLDVHRRVMDVNYFAPIALTTALLPTMKSQDGGTIVVISSVQGRVSIPFRSAYAASKHACQAYFDALRAELFDTSLNILVVNPGWIKTNFSMNAVKYDGSKYSMMDETTASGSTPKKAAEQILRAVITKNKEVLLSTLLPRLVIYLRVLFPGIYFIIMSNRARRGKKQFV